METRIQKHLKYRAELIKDGSTTVNKEGTPRRTNTLPINSVMSVEKESKNDDYYAKLHRQKVIFNCILFAFLLAFIAGVIILGVFLFKGGR